MKAQQGFTLIELAIVLVIVTILVGGLAMPLSAQIQARRIAETKKIMEEAREAIFGYAMTHTTISATCTCTYALSPGPSPCSGVLDTTPLDHCPAPRCVAPEFPTCPATSISLKLTLPKYHYLPCPDKFDDNDASTTNDGDGIEEVRIGGACPQTEGYLPWVTLATGAQDAWGNRLHYSVTASYADSDAGFSNASEGNKNICDSSVGSCAGNVAANVPVVLISYGPNGWGARNVNGSTLQPPTSDDERENISTTAGLDPDAYITHPPTQGPGIEFDDLVVWLSHPLLISRVCPTPGGCP